MSDAINKVKAKNEFQKNLSRGRRIASKFSFLYRGNRCLLSLKELTNIAQPREESHLGDHEIKLNEIIGSEDRSGDFAEGFLPIKPWMEQRWIKIWQLMQSGILEEPIDVLEYANVYFVRDGNHRVSVAKSLKREFIRAKITHLGVPYRLHKRFTRNNLEDFKHLVNFHNKTGFLNYIPEAKFDIKRLQSWEILEKEINCWNPSWYERHNQETGDIDRGDQQRYWYSRVYSYILNHIKKASLHYLFPGWGNGDVALEMIRLWNSFPEPDNFTIEDMYEIFLKRTKRIKFFLAPFRYVLEKIDYLRRTSFDERCIFLDMSNIKEIRPDFRLPADLGKAYWRKLHFELFRSHFHKMKRRMGRSPYLNELVEDWYDHVWLPRTD